MPDFHFDKNPHTPQLVCRVSEYRKWVHRGLRSDPAMRSGERLEVIKRIRRNELEKKRLRNIVRCTGKKKDQGEKKIRFR
jgi:hypothetical protein